MIPDPGPQFGVPKGANAVAGSELGDNALAGSRKGGNA